MCTNVVFRLANNEEIKALQKKVNKPPPAEKKVDSTEEIPSIFYTRLLPSPVFQ